MRKFDNERRENLNRFIVAIVHMSDLSCFYMEALCG